MERDGKLEQGQMLMPFYRTPTGMVHMHGRNLPALCGARVLIAGHEQICMVASDFLCDGPDTTGQRKTCDAPLCEAHARQIGSNQHLCPSCFLKHRDADPQRGLFTSLV